MAKRHNKRSILFHIAVIGFILPFFTVIFLCSIFGLLLYFYRLLHRIAAALFRPNLKGILPPLNHVFTHDRWEDIPTYNVCISLIFEGNMSTEHLVNAFQEKVLQCRKSDGELEYPELTKYWTRFGSYFFWTEEEHFDLREHIRLAKGSGEDSDEFGVVKSCSEERFQEIFTRLLADPWPVNRSPWEWIVIPNYRPTSTFEDGIQRTATIFRINHALGEGYSVHNMLMKVSSSAINPILKRSDLKPSLCTRFIRLLRVLSSSYDLTAEVLDFLVRLRVDSYNWMTSVSKPSEKYMVVHTKGVLVQEIKKIRKKFTVKFSTVVVTAVLGALYRMSQDAGLTAPKGINMVAPVPMPNHPGGLKNNVSARILRIPMAAKDSASRLRSVQRIMESGIKFLPDVNFLILKFVGLLPTWVLSTSPPSGYTLDCTSIPGPAEACYSGPHRIESVMASFGSGPAGLDGSGVCAVTALSTFGTLTIALVITPKKCLSLPSIVASKFDQYVKDEIAQLMQADADSTNIDMSLLQV